jgi:putative oxidoreductase
MREPDFTITRERTMDKLLNIAARILMSQMFIIAGIGMITGYAGTQADMAKLGVPGPCCR